MLSRLLCIGVLSLTSALALSADREPRSGPNRADYLDKVAVLLDLNEGQKVQVQQLMDEQHQQKRAQMRTLREQAQSSGQRPDFEQMRTQRLQADKELVDKLRPVLSDVQLTKFEVLRELTAPHKHGPRPQRGQPR